MSLLDRYARIAGMSDEAWRRHANPWSVWTRFAAIPLLILAVWSRTWIGWWALAAVALVIVWLWSNPHVFPPIDEPRAWSSRGIYGERLWMRDRGGMSSGFRVAQRIWLITGLGAVLLLGWGLIALDPWPTATGAGLLVITQLWRIDRLGQYYDQRASGTAAPS